MSQTKTTTNDCPGCKREAEPGWIETDNNGPIVPCWLCNRERWLERASELDAEAWASPMPARMQARRNRSYAQAVKEFKDAC